MWGTVMEGNLVNLASVNAETIPKSPANAGVVLILEDHADVETGLILENRVDKVTLIPEDHTDEEIVRVHTDMLTGARFPRRATSPQRSYGCHEPSLTESSSVAVFERN